MRTTITTEMVLTVLSSKRWRLARHIAAELHTSTEIVTPILAHGLTLNVLVFDNAWKIRKKATQEQIRNYIEAKSTVPQLTEDEIKTYAWRIIEFQPNFKPQTSKKKAKRQKRKTASAPSVRDYDQQKLDSIDMDTKNALNEIQFGYGRKKSSEWNDSQAFALEKRLSEIAAKKQTNN